MIQGFQQAIDSTRAVLANVAPEQLESSTPCASWNVSQLIDHIVGAQHFFAASLRGEQPAGDAPTFASGDFVASFDEAAAACVAAFSEEGALQRSVALPFGEMPGAAWLGLATTDTFTHGWDLAKATGQSTDLAPELATGLLQTSRMMIQPGFRGEDGQAPFTAEQAAPEGASAADQLAAFLGRTV